MSYSTPDTLLSHRPLIDTISNGNSDIVDQEYNAAFAVEDDYIINPGWKAMVQRATTRIPRRIQRNAMIYMIYLILLAIGWIAWHNHFGPKYAQYRREIRAMEAIPASTYGTNARPKFKDMIHIQTLNEKYLPVGDRRLVIVGDVHGCAEELKALLEKVKFTEGRDHLIFTGDIVAKGPDSVGVVTLAQQLGASCVRGNHEDKLLLTIAEMQTKRVPLRELEDANDRNAEFHDESAHSQGEINRRKLAKQFSEEQIAWLKACPVILRLRKVPGLGQAVVVHAGLVPDIPLEQQDPRQCMNMRTIDLNTRIPSPDHKGFHWDKLWNYRQKKLPASGRVTVVYGHDARRGKNVHKYSKGLDSSCVRGGQLTALVIDADGRQKYVQVQCKGYRA